MQTPWHIKEEKGTRRINYDSERTMQLLFNAMCGVAESYNLSSPFLFNSSMNSSIYAIYTLCVGDLVYELGSRDLARLHKLEPFENVLETAVHVLDGVGSDVVLLNEIGGVLAELDVEFSVRGDGRDG
jgi:hypothetical protein